MCGPIDKNCFVAGHKGMVGSSLVRLLKSDCDNGIIIRDRHELNLLDQKSVNQFFGERKIHEVYLAAAKVGGIYANNKYPADFIYQNLMIEANIIHEAWASGVKKILFLGSSCIYPKFSSQPIREEELLTGALEATNEPYAIAKIAGIKLCESYNRQHANDGVDYRAIMPTNLYGPGGNYHPEHSHVMPALIRRFHEAKEQKKPEVIIWGSGEPRREFLFVDDLAKAAFHLMRLPKTDLEAITKPMLSHLNVGFGSDISIADLALLIQSIVGYKGRIIFDRSKPDGTPRKLLDSSRLRSTGWMPTISLEEGISLAYQDFVSRFAR